MMTLSPNKSPEPTAIGAGCSAVAVHATSVGVGSAFYVGWLMHSTIFHTIVVAAFLCFAPPAAHGADLTTLNFTNETVVANSRTVISALNSGDTQDEATVRALVGSQVAFSGSGPLTQTNHTANLLIADNVILDVEMLPAGDVRRSGGAKPYYMRAHRGVYSAEVLGTLKRVDFEKRVVYIQAKPEDWRDGPVF